MAEQAPFIQNAVAPTSHGSDGPLTRQLAVSLALTNYLAQIAGGAAIDTAGPFTTFSPTRLPQITLGAGGANPVIYTLTGYRIDDVSATPTEVTQTITAAGAGTYKATVPMIITRLQSDIDPIGTTDLQAGDTWVYPAARAIRVGTSGNIAGQPMENGGIDVTLPFLAGLDPSRYSIIRITGTTASGLGLGW
jgi:hypothetical protein